MAYIADTSGGIIELNEKSTKMSRGRVEIRQGNNVAREITIRHVEPSHDEFSSRGKPY